MIHFLIVQLGSADLVALALNSIRIYAPASMVDVVTLPADTHDPRAHGHAIDQWRETYKGQVWDDDIVVLMDPDVVLLSHQWRQYLDRTFALPRVGIWGAGCTEDMGPRIHASMMAIRGRVWNTLNASFTPCRDVRERMWRDTGGLYCLFAKDAGWALAPEQRSLGSDWHGAACWWGRQEWNVEIQATRQATAYAYMGGTSKMYTPVPLWAHLGGSSHSDVQRMTWRQRWLSPWRRRAIWRRQHFIRAARAHLTR